MRRVLKCAGTDQKISVAQVPSAFDLQDLIEIDHGYYCLDNENAIQATKDLIHMNEFLYDVATVCPEFPDCHIDIGDIKFEYKPDESHRDYVFLKIEPLTPSGKPPKYPIEMQFNTSISFQVKANYGKDSRIQKCRIVAFKNSYCYEMHLAMHDDELKIHSIYRTNLMEYAKEKIYEYPKD